MTVEVLVVGITMYSNIIIQKRLLGRGGGLLLVIKHHAVVVITGYMTI
jgi:hypothetical protein